MSCACTTRAVEVQYVIQALQQASVVAAAHTDDGKCMLQLNDSSQLPIARPTAAGDDVADVAAVLLVELPVCGTVQLHLWTPWLCRCQLVACCRTRSAGCSVMSTVLTCTAWHCSCAQMCCVVCQATHSEWMQQQCCTTALAAAS